MANIAVAVVVVVAVAVAVAVVVVVVVVVLLSSSLLLLLPKYRDVLADTTFGVAERLAIHAGSETCGG